MPAGFDKKAQNQPLVPPLGGKLNGPTEAKGGLGPGAPVKPVGKLPASK